ncbi:MAG: hypothetical protein M0P71_01130 [Melioribacteraceae bacterium]|nr:hypothetical protein [Melioribacteraceae bacterium]
MNQITKTEVIKNCVDYFNGDELAGGICANKYLLRDRDGNFVESSPTDIFKRVAGEFTRIESKYPNPLSYEEIIGSLDGFKKIIPQGSPLSGIGNDFKTVSLANCFLIESPKDSYSGIIKTDEELASICKRRGGVGVDLSSLRPSGSIVNNSANTSDGVTCFMNRYSNTIKEVCQNGRRGAGMLGLDCRHPDIIEFIKIKRDLNKVNGANISIKWNNDFIEHVKSNSKYVLRFPVDSPVETAKYTKEVNAKEVWDLFVESNWLSAEPGNFYWDKVISQSLSDCYADVGFKTELSNPCGELVLSPYSSCILMAINLTGFVCNPYLENSNFNFDDFSKNVRIATRLIDNLVDLEIEKIDKIITKIKSDPEDEDLKRNELKLWEKIRINYINGRRTGLGITGYGDMLAMLGIKYSSKEAFKFSEYLFKIFHEMNMLENCVLSQERGAFPVFNWEKEKNCHYIKILPEKLQEEISKYGRRNISTTTIAPAGCVHKDTNIKLENNQMASIGDIFKMNGVDIDELSGVMNMWFNVNEEIYVKDMFGNDKKITKLYWKGLSIGRKTVFEDGYILNSSNDHKLLVKVDDENCEWKKVSEIKKDDIIIQQC